MPKILVTIPEKRFSDAEIVAVQTTLENCYRKLLGENQNPEFFWSLLPAEQSYVAGQQDEIFVILVEVANGFDQDRRESCLMEFNRVFADAAGISNQKPLVTFADTSVIEAYMQANRNRLKSWSKLRFLLATIFHARRSKKTKGYAALRTNL